MRPPASSDPDSDSEAGPGPGRWVLTDPVRSAQGPRLWRGLLEALKDADAEPVVCDIAALSADLPTVDLLARLKLAAERRGRPISFVGPSPEVAGLLALVGLGDVLGLPGLGLEPGREAEEGKQPSGVEERVETDDAPL